MIKLTQIKNGKVIYTAELEKYNYSVPQFIDNEALKITIEYSTSTIIIEPIDATQQVV